MPGQVLTRPPRFSVSYKFPGDGWWCWCVDGTLSSKHPGISQLPESLPGPMPAVLQPQPGYPHDQKLATSPAVLPLLVRSPA